MTVILSEKRRDAKEVTEPAERALAPYIEEGNITSYSQELVPYFSLRHYWIDLLQREDLWQNEAARYYTLLQVEVLTAEIRTRIIKKVFEPNKVNKIIYES